MHRTHRCYSEHLLAFAPLEPRYAPGALAAIDEDEMNRLVATVGFAVVVFLQQERKSLGLTEAEGRALMSAQSLLVVAPLTYAEATALRRRGLGACLPT